MEIMNNFKLLILLLSSLHINCCMVGGGPNLASQYIAPYREEKCPDYLSLQQCALLYTVDKCYGDSYEIWEDQTSLNGKKYIGSLVVKEGCVLSIKDDKGAWWQTDHDRRYGLMGRTEAERRFTNVKFKREYKPFHFKESLIGAIEVDILDCSCNRYHGCPNSRTLPPRTTSDRSMCAKVYQHATDDPNTSCFGRSRDIYNGEQVKDFEGDKLNNQISSIIVRDGCTFTGYEHSRYQGAKSSFTGGTTQLGSQLDNKISSYMCKCGFPALHCNPNESWTKITACSNPDSTEMTCKYWVSYGFTTGNTNSMDHGTSQSFEVSFGVELGKVFSLHSFKSTTGYNWKTSTATTKTESEETKFVVEFKVPPGEVYALYQLWGKCGQTDVKTKYFEVRNELTTEVIEHKGDSS